MTVGTGKDIMIPIEKSLDALSPYRAVLLVSERSKEKFAEASRNYPTVRRKDFLN